MALPGGLLARNNTPLWGQPFNAYTRRAPTRAVGGGYVPDIVTGGSPAAHPGDLTALTPEDPYVPGIVSGDPTEAPPIPGADITATTPDTAMPAFSDRKRPEKSASVDAFLGAAQDKPIGPLTALGDLAQFGVGRSQEKKYNTAAAAYEQEPFDYLRKALAEGTPIDDALKNSPYPELFKLWLAREQNQVKNIPDAYQTYILSLAPGEKPTGPGFRKYQLEQRTAGASNVTTSIGGEKIPTELSKDAIEASSTADQIESNVEELAVMRDLAAEADTGVTAPITTRLKAILQDFGIQVGNDDVDLMQTLNAQQNQMALRLRNPKSGFGLTGNTSNQDIIFLKDAVAGIEKTPAANYAILTTMMAKQRRLAMLERARSEFIFKNGTLAGWGEERRRLVDSTPLFEPDEQAAIQGLRTSKLATAGTGSAVENGDYDVVPDGKGGVKLVPRKK